MQRLLILPLNRLNHCLTIGRIFRVYLQIPTRSDTHSA